MTTYGETLLDPLGVYYQQHQSFPGINLPFTAANSEQRRLLNQAKNCYGTRDYCNN
ncbi:hypothetical protein [[Limnothrix rosea] IAM M-220]|uniref:hypothetical protein n=1 Tax=[Limnothrix rosea] IAM M-220 TaxID=454133 RepID=UPI0015C56F03|nr:hypothetical protein [[Limnothrix rosea] IAM M-220]